MTFVVLTGDTDLSVGALVAFSGLVLSRPYAGAGLPSWLAVALTLVVGPLIAGLRSDDRQVARKCAQDAGAMLL